MVGPNSTFTSKIRGRKALPQTVHLKRAGGDICEKGRVGAGREDKNSCSASGIQVITRKCQKPAENLDWLTRIGRDL